MSQKLSRRELLAGFAKVCSTGATLVAMTGCSKPRSLDATDQAEACVDTGSLSPAEVGLRDSLGYVPVSKTPPQLCGGCAFFEPGERNCGTCQLLHGPVSAGGHCRSFSERKG